MQPGFPIQSGLLIQEIEQLIAEDVPYGDLTTHALGIGGLPGRLVFEARDECVVCGTEEARQVFLRLGADAGVAAASGSAVPAGARLLEAHGAASALLAGWKVAQTLVEWASGISSAVAQLQAAAGSGAAGARVACTRKMVPLTRRLSVKAVLAGGGAMHRTGLSDSVLVFPEHLVFEAGGMAAAVGRLRERAPERAIAVEVNSVEQALAAAGCADILQLEKFSVADVATVASAVRAGIVFRGSTDGRRGAPVVAAAGGINLSNAAAYAAAGADVLVSSWPYQAPPRDVRVVFSRH